MSGLEAAQLAKDVQAASNSADYRVDVYTAWPCETCKVRVVHLPTGRVGVATGRGIIRTRTKAFEKVL